MGLGRSLACLAPGLLVYLSGGFALAADIFVDGDQACPGTGTTDDPYCDIQTAFDAGLGPGDHVKIRDSANPYTGEAVTQADGTAANRIYVEPDDGHSPILRGRLRFHNPKYLTIHNLTWDGGNTSGINDAIMLRTIQGNDIIDCEILNNQILNWQQSGSVSTPTAIEVWAQDGDNINGIVIRGNRILGSRHAGISVEDVVSGTIADNEIADLQCGLGPIDLIRAVGIELSNSVDIEISGNHVHSFQPACDLGAFDQIDGIRIDDDSNNGSLFGNYVHDIPIDDLGRGIYIYDAANSWTIHHNIVTNVARCGICLGRFNFSSTEDALLVSNTILGSGRYGIELLRFGGLFARNNLVLASGEAAISFDAEAVMAGMHDLDHNLYWDTDAGANVGQWGDGVTLDAGEWSAACGCDQNAVNENPLLADPGAEDLTPAVGSPAGDAGVEVDGVVSAFHGAGVDIGALEPPLPVSASVPMDAPDTVVLVIENDVAPPLLLEGGCNGFAVRIDGSDAGLTGCDTPSVTELSIRLAQTVVEGDEVELEYTGGLTLDSAEIGGFLSARLQPFMLAVQNDAPPGSTDSGAETTSDSGGTGVSTDGTGGSSGADGETTNGAADDASGCGCTTPARARWPWLLALVPVVRRRRQPR